MNDKEFEYYDRMMRQNRGIDFSKSYEYDEDDVIPHKCRKCEYDYHTCKMNPDMCDTHKRKGRKHR